jgi:hypothetical protein
MATVKKAGAKTPAKPKKVFVEVTGADNKKTKYELLGGPNKKYIFQGETFTKETAAKNEALIDSLVATGSPLLEEV